ncbi:MAG: hypothetical protein OER86_14390, partial [Phycisphaerae bacterium]|nr:hypothetical protein [Phycisphaerae bacterium]
MQVFVLVMMMALMLHDEQQWIQQPLFEDWTLLAAVFAPLVLLLGLEAVACGYVRRRIDRHPTDCGSALRILDLVYTFTRPLMLASFIASLAFLGWLQWLRREIHPDLLLPDLAAAAPTLAAVIASWWLYYPIDRRVRQMSLHRQIGGGYPVWPIWSRGQYVLFQIRHSLLLMLVPLVLLLGWVQSVEALADRHAGVRAYQGFLAAGGGLAIFLIAPLLI